jgi:hypothetical protein
MRSFRAGDPDVPVTAEEESGAGAGRLTKGPRFHPYLVWQQTCDLLPHRLGGSEQPGGGYSGGGHSGGYGAGGHGH